MYGNNQWGTINALGKVDWTAQKPMAGKPVLGLHQALPWLQRTAHMRQISQQYLKNRATRPAFYMDPIAAQEKAQLQLAKDRELSNISHAEAQNQFDYTTALDGLRRDYGDAVGNTNAEIGFSNLGDSRISAVPLGDLASKLLTSETENKRQRDLQINDAARLQGLATNEFNVGLQNAEQMGRERWAATHQGQKAPAVRKAGDTWVEGGIRYRMNANGVPVTAGQANVKAKPKFQSFKTFKAGNGQILPRGNG
jgi:hypothetical protein